MANPPTSAFCGCCTPTVLRPQADVLNRPGLRAISYRIGTFATFRQALLENIASEPRPGPLTSRADDEYAVTFMELFAAVGDVLTFYNERIANELFLRTARERDSVLRQVRLIGYRLRPGLAATTMLAFSLDAGADARVRKGFKVMSVPGQDEQPQTFETLEQTVAHADLNEVPAFAPPIYFEAFQQGSTSGLIVGRPEQLGVDDRLVVFGRGAIEEKKVKALTVSAEGERLTFTPGVQTAFLWPGAARAAKTLRRLRFFGHNAPLSENIYVPASPPAVLWPTWIASPVSGAFGGNLTDYPLDGRRPAAGRPAPRRRRAGPASPAPNRGRRRRRHPPRQAGPDRGQRHLRDPAPDDLRPPGDRGAVHRRPSRRRPLRNRGVPDSEPGHRLPAAMVSAGRRGFHRRRDADRSPPPCALTSLSAP